MSFRRNLVWPILFAAVVVGASHRSQVASPHIANIDKLAHFAVYGMLATLTCRLGNGWRAAWLALAMTSLFGATDEVHQSFVPGRMASMADWVADTLGALLAVGLYRGWTPYRRLLEMSIGRKRARPDCPTR